MPKLFITRLAMVSALSIPGAVHAQTPGAAPAALSVEARALAFEAVNPAQPNGDLLTAPRRLAAAIVAADGFQPKQVTDVGSFTGEFLQAFMVQFPEAKGQWTEPVDNSRPVALARLKQYGDRVTYRIGCPSRDLADNCVPAGTDVLLTSWLSIHQDLAGIRRFYKTAYGIVPAGGWVLNIDHVASADEGWNKRLSAARGIAVGAGLAAKVEGPPVHHADFHTPTLDDQIKGLRDAGFTDIHVAWQRLDTVLLMARK